MIKAVAACTCWLQLERQGTMFDQPPAHFVRTRPLRQWEQDVRVKDPAFTLSKEENARPSLQER